VFYFREGLVYFFADYFVPSLRSGANPCDLFCSKSGDFAQRVTSSLRFARVQIRVICFAQSRETLRSGYINHAKGLLSPVAAL